MNEESIQQRHKPCTPNFVTVLDRHVLFKNTLFAVPGGFFPQQMQRLYGIKSELDPQHYGKLGELIELIERVEGSLSQEAYELCRKLEETLVVMERKIGRKELSYHTSQMDSIEIATSDAFREYQLDLESRFRSCIWGADRYLVKVLTSTNPLKAITSGGIAGVAARKEHFERMLAYSEQELIDLATLRSEQMFSP